MLDIHGTSIFLTRGDTAYLQFPLYNVVYKDGKISEKTKYEIGDGDTLTLTVSKKANDISAVVFSHTTSEGDVIKIVPSDTRGLNIGQYHYDVELVRANGDVFTVVKDSAFNITSEVTMPNE
ncbi:MAG: hypothetical protein KBT06_00605 [Prevotellaceae bacterium]|nr:hypothetical protein [Candidatus Colivivens equi]